MKIKTASEFDTILEILAQRIFLEKESKCYKYHNTNEIPINIFDYIVKTNYMNLSKDFDFQDLICFN